MRKEIGRFQIIEQLGRGGMSVVYLAHDPTTKREVALKLLAPLFGEDEEARRRFRNEAQIVAGLEHPAVVPLYEFGEFEAQPYLVMRYMKGGALSERIQGPMSLGEIERIFSRLCPALDRAHERGIIHRDIKPDNVLFDEDGLAYLADFGIARLAEATKTMTIAGTPAYMSPEQVTGDRTLDGRSDIYALGVMLYLLLTGQSPYEADTPTQLMMKHVLEPVPNVLAANPTLPRTADTLIRRAMSKSPDERFETGHALVGGLKSLWQVGGAAHLPLGPDKAEAESIAVQPTPMAETAVLKEPTDVIDKEANAVMPSLAKTSALPKQAEAGKAALSRTAVWLSAGLLLMVVLALVLGPRLLGNRPPEEPVANSVATPPPEANGVVPPAGDNRAIPGGSIGLRETINGRVTDERPQIWQYEGEAATVDVQLESDGRQSLALLVFPPGADEPMPYVDFASPGEAERLTFYNIVPGTEFGVRDTNNDGAAYQLTVTPSRFEPLRIGSQIEADLLGANPAIFSFAPETDTAVNIVLEMDEKDSGLLIVYDAEGGNADNWLYLASEPKEPGVWRLENIFLEGGEAYRIFVRDAANDGADFTLSIRPVAGE